MEKFTLIELKLISEILEFRFYDMFMSHNKRDKNVKISDFKTLGKHHFPDIRFKELIEKGFVTHIKCKTFSIMQIIFQLISKHWKNSLKK